MSDYDDSILEIHKAHQASSEKYTYFLLAAAGAAIGFAVQKTEGAKLTWALLPVAAATVMWALSFAAGCKNVVAVQTAMVNNNTLLELKRGSHVAQPSHPQHLEIAMRATREAFEKHSSRAAFFGRWQFRLLILGAVLFIVWRVVEIVQS